MSTNQDPSQNPDNIEARGQEAKLREALDWVRVTTSNLLSRSPEQPVSIGDSLYHRSKTILDSDEHGSSVLSRLRPEDPDETDTMSLRLVDNSTESESAYTFSYDSDKSMSLKDEAGISITDPERVITLHEYLTEVLKRRNGEEEVLERKASPASEIAPSVSPEDALGDSIHNFRQTRTGGL